MNSLKLKKIFKVAKIPFNIKNDIKNALYRESWIVHQDKRRPLRKRTNSDGVSKNTNVVRIT